MASSALAVRSLGTCLPSAGAHGLSEREPDRGCCPLAPAVQKQHYQTAHSGAACTVRQVGGRRQVGRRPRVVTAQAAVASPSMAAHLGTSTILGRFAELKEKNEVALIPFIVAGDPNLETTEKALVALCEAGADIIELGVPYSDPLADGPVIQAAATRALAQGTDLSSVINMLAKVSPRLTAPIVLFTYFNPIMKRGLQAFMQEVKAAGAAGLVVPDIPLEETGPIREAASANGLELILLTTPTTPLERMRAISEVSEGFVYLVSLTGVTGARAAIEGRVEALVKQMKEVTDKPVAVGFGISKPEHAAQIAQWGADGVIVGSAIVRVLGEASSPEEGLSAMKTFTRDLKDSLRR